VLLITSRVARLGKHHKNMYKMWCDVHPGKDHDINYPVRSCPQLKWHHTSSLRLPFWVSSLPRPLARLQKFILSSRHGSAPRLEDAHRRTPPWLSTPPRIGSTRRTTLPLAAVTGEVAPTPLRARTRRHVRRTASWRVSPITRTSVYRPRAVT
jgi:hypothetical protein